MALTGITYADGTKVTYDYDEVGNLQQQFIGKQVVFTKTYDSATKTLTSTDANGAATKVVYDDMGKVSQVIDPFGYGNVLAEYDGSGNLIARYNHGIGLVNKTNASNQNYFYDFDAIGSTVGLTGTAGTNLNRYSYRPFGEDFYETETVANSFEYVGQWGVTEEANIITEIDLVNSAVNWTLSNYLENLYFDWQQCN